MALPSWKIRSNSTESGPASMPDVRLRRVVIQAVFLSVILNTIGQFLFKTAAVQSVASPFGLFQESWTWIALLVYAASAVTWLWVLARAQLSFVYPILSVSFPLVVGLSVILFGEPVSLIRWIGVAGIVVGVSLLTKT
ncbi:MAG: DMT family transporter [Acidobacteriota bacterium]